MDGVRHVRRQCYDNPAWNRSEEMENGESEPVTFLKPGMEVQVIGNCVMIKTACEDDAVILAQVLIQISGKNVLIEEGDDA